MTNLTVVYSYFHLICMTAYYILPFYFYLKVFVLSAQRMQSSAHPEDLTSTRIFDTEVSLGDRQRVQA